MPTRMFAAEHNTESAISAVACKARAVSPVDSAASSSDTETRHAAVKVMSKRMMPNLYLYLIKNYAMKSWEKM